MDINDIFNSYPMCIILFALGIYGIKQNIKNKGGLINPARSWLGSILLIIASIVVFLSKLLN